MQKRTRCFARAIAIVVALTVTGSATAWSWPLSGDVLRGFSFGDDPYASGLHRGVDVGGAAGEPIEAPVAGTVSFVGTVPTHGRTLTIVTEDGYAVTLTHLGETSVAKGATVAEGDRVGLAGSSGTVEHEATYVHLGVRVASEPEGYVDPMRFLPTRPVRAAPQPAPGATPVVATSPAPVEPSPAHVEPAAGQTDGVSSRERPASVVPEPVLPPLESGLPVRADPSDEAPAGGSSGHDPVPGSVVALTPATPGDTDGVQAATTPNVVAPPPMIPSVASPRPITPTQQAVVSEPSATSEPAAAAEGNPLVRSAPRDTADEAQTRSVTMPADRVERVVPAEVDAFAADGTSAPGPAPSTGGPFARAPSPGALGRRTSPPTVLELDGQPLERVAAMMVELQDGPAVSPAVPQPASDVMVASPSTNSLEGRVAGGGAASRPHLAVRRGVVPVSRSSGLGPLVDTLREDRIGPLGGTLWAAVLLALVVGIWVLAGLAARPGDGSPSGSHSGILSAPRNAG